MNRLETKVDRLLKLARERQGDSLEGYLKLSDFHEGYYECDHVTPWTISACNPNADLMLISQDWASADFLNKEKNPEQKRLGQVEDLATNRNLKNLLKNYMGLSFSETYATDAFVFIKYGSMNARLPFNALVESVRRYTLRQIDIVHPKMVICLGSAPFNAIRRAIDPKLGRINLSEAFKVADPFHTAHKDIPIFGVAHPGGLGTSAVGGEKVTGPRWEQLGQFFRSLNGERS